MEGARTDTPSGWVADDAAVAPVVAVVVLVAVVVAGGAATYVAVSEFDLGGDVAVLGFSVHRFGCLSGFRVAGDASPSGAAPAWNDLEVHVDGASPYGVEVHGVGTANAPWDGAALPDRRPVAAGDMVRVGIGERTERVAIEVVHRPTGDLLYRGQALAPQPDERPPTTTLGLANGATVTSLATLTGRARDSCSGVGRVEVSLVEVATGRTYTPSGLSAGSPAALAAQLGAGAANGKASWSVDVDESLLARGDYRVVATPYDRAGRAGPTVEATVTYAPPLPGAFDPGHAYEDVNNDALYTEGLDLPIPDREVLDGIHAVSDERYGLVLPPSLPDVAAASVAFRGGSRGGHLIVAVDVTAYAGHVHLTAGDDVELRGAPLVVADAGHVRLQADGWVRAEGVRVAAVHHLQVQAKAGVAMNRSTLASTGTYLDVRTHGQGGPIWLEGAALDALHHLAVFARGELRADGLKATSGQTHVKLGTQQPGADDAWLRDAVLTARHHITVDVGGTLTADRIEALTPYEDVRLNAKQGGLSAVDARVVGRKTVEVLAGGDLTADGATVTSTDHRTKVEAGRHGGSGGAGGAGGTGGAGTGGDLSARDATLSAGRGDLEVRAAGAIDLTGATGASPWAKVDVEANGGPLTLRAATLTARTKVEVDAEGDIDAAGAHLRSQYGDVRLDAEDPARTVGVDRATFTDRNDVAKAAPKGVGIDGVPKAGSIDHDG